MKRSTLWILIVWSLFLATVSCSPGGRYERRLTRELASGERCDTLFMGIYLGMSEQDFYTHCWELNREGLIRQGSFNMTVEYQMKDELKHPATMNFYPVFESDRIVEMPVRFSYNGWAPWNKELSSAQLAEDIRFWYEEIYGPGFIKVKHPEHGTAFVKIDGNRRITIFHEPDLYAWAIFTDMEAKDNPETFPENPALP